MLLIYSAFIIAFCYQPAFTSATQDDTQTHPIVKNVSSNLTNTSATIAINQTKNVQTTETPKPVNGSTAIVNTELGAVPVQTTTSNDKGNTTHDLKVDVTKSSNSSNVTLHPHMGRENVQDVEQPPTNLSSSEKPDSSKSAITDLKNVTNSSHSKPRKGAVYVETTPKSVAINVTKSTTTTTTTTTAAPKKPTVTVGDNDDESLSNKQSSKSESSSSDGGAENMFVVNSHKSSSNFVIPIVAVILSVPLVAIVISVLYKRGTEWWQHRHYSRMDFLIDGMYNT